MYWGNQKHEEGLFFEDRSSKNDKRGAPKVEVKPLPLHLQHEFVGPNQTFPVIISAKFNYA